MDRRVSVRSHLVVLFAVLTLALPWTVWGQAQNGTITGTVTDNAGVVPGAMVVATEASTGVSHSAPSN